MAANAHRFRIKLIFFNYLSFESEGQYLKKNKCIWFEKALGVRLSIRLQVSMIDFSIVPGIYIII